MADSDNVVLLQLGPFGSLDSRTSPIYVNPSNAIIASNADTHRQTGSLLNFFGRAFFARFAILGQNAQLVIVARYVTSPTQVFYIVQTASGKTAYIDSLTKVTSSLSEEVLPFTQAVQSNGVLYCNNGQQIFLGVDGALHVALWQYPAPDATDFMYSVAAGPPGKALQAATYYYAFVQVVSIPLADGTIEQITSPTGALEPYPYSFEASGIVQAEIQSVADPHSLLNVAPAVWPQIPTGTVVTITAAGSGKFNISDTLGDSQIGVLAGSTVFIASTVFTLTTVTDITPGRQASYRLVPDNVGPPPDPAIIDQITDPFGIFGVIPDIVPNLPTNVVVNVVATGVTTYTITDSLGDSQVGVAGGAWVIIGGSYFKLIGTSVSVGNSAQFSIAAQSEGLPAVIDGIFTGTTDDGYLYVTQVYRQSTVQPIWYLLTTLTDNGEYTDYATDFSISGNQQLLLNRDQPLVMQYPGSPIGVHQDRTWTMGIVKNANTLGFPQTQLMFSAEGKPWQFDLILQTQLVEDADTPLKSAVTTLPAGQIPAGMISMGSSFMLFKNGSTFIEVGVDVQTYQPLKLFPDIGLIAPASLFEANGMIGWLAAQGPFIYDGGALSWVGKEIYNALQAIPPAHQVNCSSFYADQQIFYSFPDVPITFVYYLPDKTWTTLPYATNSAVYAASYVSDPFSPATSFKWNEVVAVRPGTNILDAWLEGKENDLGVGTLVTWCSPISNSGSPFTTKNYVYVGLEAPAQDAIATVVFQADPGSPTQPPADTLQFDLSEGPLFHVRPISQGSSIGTACKVTITIQTAAGATEPVQIYSVIVGGTAKRAWVQHANG